MYFNRPGNKVGWIELITGCMFAGKTEEFIRRLVRYQYGKYSVQVFKPTIDNRYSMDDVVSHSKNLIAAIPVHNSMELMKKLDANTEIIGVDEVQFFDKQIVDVVENLANSGKIVVVNGLDKDFKNEAFYNVEKLFVKAEYVKKLHAICVVCGNLANCTQRIIDGKPAAYDDPIVVIGEKDTYEARCRHCHIINKNS